MPKSTTLVINTLAASEARIRLRLDRAANRLEDYDPIDILGLRLGVKLLNVADRLTAFRERHRNLSASAKQPPYQT